VPVWVFYVPVGVVVTQASAWAGIGRCTPIDANHIDIARPLTRMAAVYTSVRSTLQDWVSQLNVESTIVPSAIVHHEATRETPSFTGREEELTELALLLSQHSTVAAHGLPGTGKTVLVREYAWRNRERYAIVWWLQASDENTIIDGLLRLGALLSPGLDRVETEKDRRTAAQRVVGQLIRGFEKPTLLIFDNLENERWLREWRPQEGVHVLATSRITAWSAEVAPIRLLAWPPSDAERYVKHASARHLLIRD
jgi:hypothetical protein